MAKLRKICSYSIIISLLILVLSNSSYATLSCASRQNSCNSGEVAILKLSTSEATGKHASVPSDANYNTIICCKSSDDTLTTTATTAACDISKGSTILKLRQPKDATTEKSDSNVFSTPTNICLSGTDQKISCRNSETGEACNADEIGIVELSAATDANTAFYGTTPFLIKVCCKQVLGDPVQGTIVNINNGLDNYDAVSASDNQWWNCNTGDYTPSGNVFGPGTAAGPTRQAREPAHDYLCYLNLAGTERIAECIGDTNPPGYSNAAGGEWASYGEKRTSGNVNYYCCSEEMWQDDLDYADCRTSAPNSACELNGYKLSQGGEDVVFGSYFSYIFQGESVSGTAPDKITNYCCGDDGDEFYIGDTSDEKCNANSAVSAKCCNNAADKLDVDGNCVALCAENTDALCSDNQDNDGDGAFDCADSECAGKTKAGVGKCCQATSVNTDCASFSLGTCGSYFCNTENRCDVIKNTERCIGTTSNECGSFKGTCTQQISGEYSCDYSVDNTKCKTNNVEDCNKFCDTDYLCKDMSLYPGTGACWLKYSDCMNNVNDNKDYTYPNLASSCFCHRPFSSCPTTITGGSGIIGTAKCV